MYRTEKERLIDAVSELRRIEAKYNVSFIARSYGYYGTSLLIRDNETNDSFDLEALEDTYYADSR